VNHCLAHMPGSVCDGRTIVLLVSLAFGSAVSGSLEANRCQRTMLVAMTLVGLAFNESHVSVRRIDQARSRE